MILNIFTEVFVNRAGEPVFHVKKTEQYYLVDDRNKNAVALFENLIFNSISIAAFVGWFGKLSYWLWLVIGLAVYFGYTIYFNKRILPQLQILEGKKTRRRKEAKLSKERMLFIILASFGITIGLIASLLYEPLKSSVDDGVIILGILMGSFLGIRYMIYYIKDVKSKA